MHARFGSPEEAFTKGFAEKQKPTRGVLAWVRLVVTSRQCVMAGSVSVGTMEVNGGR
ncbi:hypothetical protein GGQ79_001382 [Ochrobactrum pecoris]|uniref:Uncharacterized protein n=1 Tax=Brucella pecoris TaxID=867683 RepID=A0AB34YNQ8_9HYPH|nr:hypothetical protein [Brucella pecoris]